MSGEHLLPSGLTFPWDTHTSISHSYLSVSCLSYCWTLGVGGYCHSIQCSLFSLFRPFSIVFHRSSESTAEPLLLSSPLRHSRRQPPVDWVAFYRWDEVEKHSFRVYGLDPSGTKRTWKKPRCFIVIQDIEEISLGDPVWPCMSL